MDYKGLIEGLKGMITDKTSPEDAEKIGGLIAGAEQLEVDHNAVVQSKEELRVKYIESIKTGSVAKSVEPPIPEEAKPITFEQCVQEQIAKRK